MPTSTISRAERRGRNRAYAGYIRNALEPTSAAIYDEMTIGDLKIHARSWANDYWPDYVE